MKLYDTEDYLRVLDLRIPRVYATNIDRGIKQVEMRAVDDPEEAIRLFKMVTAIHLVDGHGADRGLYEAHLACVFDRRGGLEAWSVHPSRATAFTTMELAAIDDVTPHTLRKLMCKRDHMAMFRVTGRRRHVDFDNIRKTLVWED